MLDAYTQKKILPRLVIALIGINLSWFGVTALIEIGNVAGESIHELILAPFGDLGGTFVVVDGKTVISAIAIGAVVGPAGLLAFWKIPGFGRYVIMIIGGLLLATLIAIMSALIFMLVRQVVLIVLVILSPIAIAAWILPATQRYFEMWRKYLSSMILFYPIFELIYSGLLLLGALLRQ